MYHTKNQCHFHGLWVKNDRYQGSLPRFTGYYIDNALECRAKYTLLVNFLKIVKFFFQEFLSAVFFLNNISDLENEDGSFVLPRKLCLF